MLLLALVAAGASGAWLASMQAGAAPAARQLLSQLYRRPQQQQQQPSLGPFDIGAGTELPACPPPLHPGRPPLDPGRPRATFLYLLPGRRLREAADSLVSLFQNFNDRWRYPIVLFHGGEAAGAGGWRDGRGRWCGSSPTATQRTLSLTLIPATHTPHTHTPHTHTHAHACVQTTSPTPLGPPPTHPPTHPCRCADDISNTTAAMHRLSRFLSPDRLCLVRFARVEFALPPGFNANRARAEGVVWPNEFPNYHHMCAWWFR